MRKRIKSVILAIGAVAFCLQSTAKATLVAPVTTMTVNIPDTVNLSSVVPPIMQPLTIIDLEQVQDQMREAAEPEDIQTETTSAPAEGTQKTVDTETRSPFIISDRSAMAISTFARISEPLKPVVLGLQDDLFQSPIDEANAPETAPTTPDHSQPLLASIPVDAELQWDVFEISCKSDPDKFCLAMAVTNQESDFDPNCVYDGGDSLGWMQIQPKWHGDRLTKYGLGWESLFDPINNVIVGLDYLEEIRDNAGLTELASHQVLMSYNMGESRCAQKMNKGVTSTDYSNAVLGYYQAYIAEFPDLQG